MLARPPLSDLSYIAARPRAELIAAIRHRAARLDPSLRILAQDLLAADTTIDLVAVDASGRLVLVMVGNVDEDLALFTRALAQRAWVAPRVRDWLQLAPALGLRLDAPVKLSLLAPSFRPETLAAAGVLGAEVVELSTYRWVETSGSVGVLIEGLDAPRMGRHPGPVDPERGDTGHQNPAPRVSPAPSPIVTPHDPAEHAGARATPPGLLEPRRRTSAARFRTGLSEEDLNLTVQETREFE